MSVAAFPAVEVNELIWVWLGAVERADIGSIPDLGFISQAHPSSRTPGYTYVRANYELLNDNIMDLGHVDYLHPNTLAQGSFATIQPKCTQDGERVSIHWDVTGVPPSRLNAAVFGDVTRIDTSTEVTWQAAGNMRLRILMRPTDAPDAPPFVSEACHLMTPETETTTHYFHCGVRNFAVDDVELTTARRAFARIAFEDEDKPMVEAVQQTMGRDADFLTMKPALLAGDVGAMRVRRVIQRLREAERTAGASVPSDF
ncbi:hypothetical protein [Sphingobium aquiterrae]|uniref:hypothetical protein n=1 Tax=Sphingobium aquiterrae TaxID=2038656 RepID=UPI003016105B